MVATLVVSLSGIGPSTLARCADLGAELDRRSVPLSLLLAPRKFVPGAALDWVRERVRGRDALVLHGFDHSTDPCHRPVSLRRRAEFSALPAHEAGLRLVAARAAVHRLGLATDVFAPPSWLASPGTVVALRRHRFAVCADMAGVRDLRTGDVRTGRVRMVGEHWSHLLSVGRAARRGGFVRLGVDAADLDRIGVRDMVLESVELALHHGAEAVTYSSTDSPRGSTRNSVPSGEVPARTR
ncbi:DUF2334 domain-containing protein [Actinosynnema sp. NPDC047251]|uniref:Deacetylase-like protein n=1 Tax=Saccharothrix espanaensis (strain ATCC 51144 / DSM 44229 / JCM 9112 / NBRC 15066 / NRRL 15764) TaxID=1179773 RepID=K0K5C2_SACES|nr:DUF2334 domain-containing protein [Saccharothrix espanaensis]CCH35475.1 Deacetylase-like protein [Saccharothrix espanaensis DSM 44229]